MPSPCHKRRHRGAARYRYHRRFQILQPSTADHVGYCGSSVSGRVLRCANSESDTLVTPAMLSVLSERSLKCSIDGETRNNLPFTDSGGLSDALALLPVRQTRTIIVTPKNQALQLVLPRYNSAGARMCQDHGRNPSIA